MPIESHHELLVAVQRAGTLLQEIQDYLQAADMHHVDRPDAKVRFPRGFIRPAGQHRRRLQFVADDALRDNLAYTLILSDTVLWLRLRTDLWGVPKEMLTKLYVFLIGSMVESITKEYLAGLCGQNYNRRLLYLVNAEVIAPELSEELEWLWDTRNRMHLFQLEAREYENEYDRECHHRCVRAFRSLLTSLSRRGRLA
jgi:hypothetical protein